MHEASEERGCDDLYPRNVIKEPWEGMMEPFRIIGNVYFIGTYQASSHLIDTGDGLILIDTGYENTLYLLVHAIWKLGFDPGDIRFIIHTHWHGDHTEGTKFLLPLTRAKTVIGVRDDDIVRDRNCFSPDIIAKDGDTLSLGNTVIHFVETPGHTAGTISLFFDTQDYGRSYRVGMFGGAGANTLIKSFLATYPDCRKDYLESLCRLRKEKVDVFIGNHTWNNDTEGKYQIMLATDTNPFIDREEWMRFLDYCQNRLEKLVDEDR